MSRSPLKIGLVQFDLHWEDPKSNREEIERLVEGTETSLDLLILPEMFTTGFTMNASISETMQGETLEWLQHQASNWNMEIMGSLIIEDGGAIYNRMIWMGKEGVRMTYDKRHLFALAGEDKVFTGGTEKIWSELHGWRIRPLICYDLRFPVWSRSMGDTDILIYVANFPEKRRYAWSQLLIARAIENQCFVIGLNRIGTDGKQHRYSGDSVVIDPSGIPILEMNDKSCLRSVTLEDIELNRIRRDLPFHLDADNFEILN